MSCKGCGWSQIGSEIGGASFALFPTLQRAVTISTAKYEAAMSSKLSKQAFGKDPSGEIELADSLLSLSRR